MFVCILSLTTSILTHGSALLTEQGHIVYPAATMGVIFNKVKNTQAFSAAHCDEVTCLDVHPKGFAASAHKVGTAQFI